MAVIQTPQGRVIGLILSESQPILEPVSDKSEQVVKKPGRPPKK